MGVVCTSIHAEPLPGAHPLTMSLPAKKSSGFKNDAKLRPRPNLSLVFTPQSFCPRHPCDCINCIRKLLLLTCKTVCFFDFIFLTDCQHSFPILNLFNFSVLCCCFLRELLNLTQTVKRQLTHLELVCNYFKYRWTKQKSGQDFLLPHREEAE